MVYIGPLSRSLDLSLLWTTSCPAVRKLAGHSLVKGRPQGPLDLLLQLALKPFLSVPDLKQPTAWMPVVLLSHCVQAQVHTHATNTHTEPPLQSLYYRAWYNQTGRSRHPADVGCDKFQAIPQTQILSIWNKEICLTSVPRLKDFYVLFQLTDSVWFSSYI
jgi:hypothetical protein